eukprot:15084912-Ditylum_brightwellii.AAC.1
MSWPQQLRQNWVLFENAKEAVPLRTMLNKLGYQQPAAPIQVDNPTTHRIIELNRDNLKFIGSQVEIIKWIISPNIIYQLTIKRRTGLWTEHKIHECHVTGHQASKTYSKAAKVNDKGSE